ncbi:hypothetical protein IGJ83_003291 [Enterococcus pernyi]
MKKGTLLLFSIVSFSSIVCASSSLVSYASEVSLDPEARNKIDGELSVMASEYSQFGFKSWNDPDKGPLPIPLPTKNLKAKNAKVHVYNIHEEETEPMHVATAKLVNHSNIDQDMRTQEYSQSFTDSTTNTTSHTFKIGEETKGVFEIPLAKFEVTVKAEYDFSNTNSTTHSETKTYKMNSQVVKVPAGRTMMVEAKLIRGKVAADLALQTELDAEIPWAIDKTGVLYEDAGGWATNYRWHYDQGQLPKHDYSTQYDFKTRDGKSRMTYDGGYSKTLSEFGSHLELDFYDITDGTENAKLVESRVGPEGVVLAD